MLLTSSRGLVGYEGRGHVAPPPPQLTSQSSCEDGAGVLFPPLPSRNGAHGRQACFCAPQLTKVLQNRVAETKASKFQAWNKTLSEHCTHCLTAHPPPWQLLLQQWLPPPYLSVRGQTLHVHGPVGHRCSGHSCKSFPEPTRNGIPQ